MKSPSPALLLLFLLGGGSGLGWWLSKKPLTNQESGAGTVESVADLKKQILLLEGQVEYLQGQVGALQDENTVLLQKLGTLGMKNVPKFVEDPEVPEKTPPDFVGLGLDIMKIRSLKAMPIPTIGASQAEVERVLLAWLRKQQPDDEAPRMALALTALGWLDKPVDPLPAQAAVLARMLGGWLDEETGTLLVIEDKPKPGIPAPDYAMAVAVGQLFKEYGKTLFPSANPDGSSENPTLTTDARLARLALLFGDAGLTRFLYSVQNPVARSTADLPMEDPDHPLNEVVTPVFLKELALFPFLPGFEFAQSLHSAGGFPQINAAYSRPPSSCAEVIDPSRFLDATRLPPVNVDFTHLEVRGQKPYWDDRLGRFSVFQVLRTYNSEEVAGRAARGWKGDHLLAYAEPEQERDHALWQTVWLKSEDATAFFQAMRVCLSQRYDLPFQRDEPLRVELKTPDRFIQLLMTHGGGGVRFVNCATAEFATALAELPLRE